MLLQLAALSAQFTEPAPASLVAYFPFDSSVDDTRNAISGTIVEGDMLGGLTGSAAVTASCAHDGGAGLSLTGGYVNYGKPPALNFNGKDDVSIMMWIKGTGGTQPTSYWDPISWHHSSTIGIVWQAHSTNGLVAAAPFSSQVTFTGATLTGEGSSEWYHLAFVRNASGAAAFVNGVQVDSYSGGAGGLAPMELCGAQGKNCPMEDGTWRVWIGGDPHYRRFHGCIDEVKVFNTRLSAAEVVAYGFKAGAGLLGSDGKVMGWLS